MIWGTTIEVRRVQQALKSFLRNFRRPQDLNEGVQEPYYMRMLKQALAEAVTAVNVDAKHIFDFGTDGPLL